MIDITTHTLVKDGMPYIKYALKSVKPFVKKMIVIDTGSTDGTVEVIKDFIKQGYPIEFLQRGPFKGSWDGGIPELTALRNEMLKMTKTEWTLQVDDDEIYTKEVFDDIARVIKQCKDLRESYSSGGASPIPELMAIAIPFYDFYEENKSFLSDVPPTSRVFRSKSIEFYNPWPFEMICVKGETNWLNKFKDPRVVTISNRFYHYTRCRKKKDTVQRPEENFNNKIIPFIGKIPDVFDDS